MFRMMLCGLIILMPLVAGCSDNTVEEGEHVWQEQERALERAEEAEQEIQEGIERQREEINRQTNQ